MVYAALSDESASEHLTRRFWTFATSLGWVREPNNNTRGTWDFLQSCIITIFFCTATSLHLNIPKQRYGDWRRRWTRLFWMTINTIAPEVFMCVAITQYLEARMVQRDIAKHCRRHHVRDPEWNLMQAFFFNMRAFVYKPSLRDHYGRTHKDAKLKSIKLKHLEAIVELGLLRDVTVDTDTIKEYAKQDRLSKTVALAQALWLLVQTSSRMAKHLPTSPLEITALAYISVTFFSWALWLNKPQGVGLSIELTGPDWAEVFRITRDREGHNPSDSNISWKVKGWKNQLPNIKRPYRAKDHLIIGLTWLFTSALFGGLHLLAWNYEFPTSPEKQLWRSSSVAIMSLPPLFYSWVLFRDFIRGHHDVDLVGRTLIILYVAARMYNMVEVFYSLRSTPPGLYETVQWPNYFPHL